MLCPTRAPFGLAFYCQSLAADPPANRAGLIPTNAGAGYA